MPGRKARQKDYDPKTQKVFDLANTRFKSIVSGNSMYPEKVQERTWAKQAWYQAAAELNIALEHEPGVISVVSPSFVPQSAPNACLTHFPAHSTLTAR